MGTRSVVAFVDDPDATTWKGRYVHWDGYPAGVGEALKAIIARDGVDVARKTITEDHYGWSSLTGGPAEKLGPGYDDGRFVSVDGYGTAYTTKDGQSSPDEWISSEDIFESWCEYVYLVTPDGPIRAYEIPYGKGMLKLISLDAEGNWVEDEAEEEVDA